MITIIIREVYRMNIASMSKVYASIALHDIRNNIERSKLKLDIRKKAYI